MPQKPEPKNAAKKGDSDELSISELDQVAGGKLPGKKKPPTLTLKRGKNSSMD